MRIIADLQIHSKYARATSKDLSLANLEKYACIKGLGLLGVGDFQHPLHRKEIDNYLQDERKGILYSKSGFPFLWQTEVSLMFSQNGKRRAVHLLVFAPSRDIANKITDYLASKGRLDYDGRPIFGMSCKQIVKDLKEIDGNIEIIPAHCLLPNEKVICESDVKPISEIKAGDKVLTHTGNFKKVNSIFSRDYKGKIYKIRPYYFREGIRVTEEHPFLAVKTVKNCSAIGGLCKPNSIAKGRCTCKEKHYLKYLPTWITARDLEVNDVLLYPRITKNEDINQIKLSENVKMDDYRIKEDYLFPKQGRQDKGINDILKVSCDLCRLIGYYLAEGYIIKKNNCIQFSFGMHESEYIDNVIQLMKDCFGIELAKKREKNGYELYFYSKVVAELFENLFYEKNKPLKAAFKRMPHWMLYLPLNKQVEIFRGWWMGDTGTTVSEILVQQMKNICLRLGIVCSIYKVSKEQSRKYNSQIGERKIMANYDCYNMSRLAFYEDRFDLLSSKEFKKFKTKLERKHGWVDEKYIYIPIKNIETFDYEGKVYNLNVEEDNSYVTPVAAVHNCMTPWFGLFGSDSGFNSIQECFEEEAKHIYAVESGMSADPGMLWRFKEISSGKVNVVSFSDAHSFWPWRIGREATIFELEELSYNNIIRAIRTGEGLIGTIETPPEYGKYHWDGHRNCKFSCSPSETKKLNGICPVCGNKLTIGVDYRVEEIAHEKQGYKPQHVKPYHKLLPLHELIALYLGSSLSSKKTWEIYNKFIDKFGNEFNILLDVSHEEMSREFLKEQLLIELIIESRNGRLKVKPGFDGEYGKVLLPDVKSSVKDSASKQMKLF